MRARLMTLAAMIVVAGAAIPPSSDGASAPRKPGPSAAAKRHGTALARAALLRRGDLGGWGASAAPHRVPRLTCSNFSPGLAGITMLGSAVSPTFKSSATGPFASETAYVYESARQAAAFWHRVITRRLETCVSHSLTGGSGNGVTFTVNHKQLLSLPKIGQRDAGYRVIGTASTTDQSVTVYLDMLVVGRGSGIAAISFTSFSVAVSRHLELRLAGVIARRLPPS